MTLLPPIASRCAGVVAASLTLALLMSACGRGGFEEVEAPDSSGNDVVLASFEPGESAAVIVADGGGNSDARAATVETVASNVTAGSKALKVTLVADAAMIGLTSDGGGGLASDWTRFRTLLVDVTSANALNAGAVRFIAKVGSSYKWCEFSNTQEVRPGTPTTLSFHLDWTDPSCGATAEDVAAVKYAYLSLAGGVGNVLHLDNLRMTRSVRVMALGDSITGSPGCWRQTLWADSLASRTLPPVDMVGLRNNVGDCATGLSRWDADHAGFGGMKLRSVGSEVGLADAGRSDTVSVSGGVTPVAGNLPVWLESTRPDVLLINLGTNDVWAGTGTDAIVAGLDKLVDQARAGHAGMRFVVAQIPLFAPVGCETACPSGAAAYNAAIAAWAKCKRSAQSPITLADLAAGWDPAAMTSDGVHPNAAGATAMGGNWKSALTAALDTEGSGPDGSCVPTEVSDLADGTSAAGTFTITSFKAGVTALTVLNNDGNPSAASQATLTLDSSGSHATDGSHAGAFTVIDPPAGGWVSASQTGNGGLADWAGYRYLKFDVTTTDTAYGGALYLQSGADWSHWCQGADAAIDAHSSGTITLDLSACAAVDLGTPQRFGLMASRAGTYYIDHVRLEGGSTSDAADLADGTTTASTYTITSFKTGTGRVTLLNNDGSASSSSQASLGHDTSGSHATEGSNAAIFTVIEPPAGGSVAIGNTTNGGLADWTGYKTLSFDVKTGDTAFSGLVVLQSGSGWNWCQGAAAEVAAHSSGTVALDLGSCTGGDLSLPQRFQLFSWGTGTFYVDNIRLGK